MDMEEFKNQFITEAKEKLQEAENSLEQLQEGYDEETLKSLKRSFHTLKGNSGAMGYQKYYELSKACNDLAQKAIDKETELNEDTMSLFGEGKDKLLYALDFISNDDPENFEDDGLIEKIKQY